MIIRKNIIKFIKQSSCTSVQVGHLIEGNGLAPLATLGIDVLATATFKPGIKR